MINISDNLKDLIQNKGYETRSGRIKFSKKLRDLFRKEIADYHSDEIEIITKMINIYNDI